MPPSRPRLWLASDQTATACAYEAFVRWLEDRRAIRSHTLSLVVHGDRLERAVAKFCAGLRQAGFAADDLLLVLHDWEDDLGVPHAHARREAVRRQLADALVAELPLGPLGSRQVHVRLVPPTTEGLYLLWAHEELGLVRDVLMRCAAERDKVRALEELIRQRGAYARSAEPAVAPTKTEIDACLGLWRTGAKRRLAERMRDAFDGAPVSALESTCLRGVQGWLEQFP